ncbi:MAG: hypothetical protein M1828_007540 [Chrysothrix sp. TS-e1954]|nr:MAG: hypothetical protein M1828_007540 [Chrysothrix sp. TS-e1954]
MGFIISTTTFALLALTILGYLSTLNFASDNGTASKLLATSQASYLPASSISLSPPKTGIAILDDTYFPAAISFSYSALSGELPQLSLLSLYFYGQGIAIWMLMLLEGFRVGNAWRLVSFVTVFGFAFENLGMGLTVPLFFLLHLATSPISRAPSGESAVEVARFKTSLLVHPTELAVLPLSVGVGCGIPTVLALTLPAEPQVAFWKSSQFWMVVRMFHPALTAVVHLLMSMLSRATVNPANKLGTPDERNKIVASGLRQVYRIITAVAMVSHVAVLTLLAAAEFAPSLFSAHALGFLTVPEVFGPLPFWREGIRRRPFTLAEGGLWFIQWEAFVSGVAVLIWALALNRDALWSRGGVLSYVVTVGKSALVTLVAGPSVAAVELLRERDEALLEETQSKPPANQSKKSIEGGAR